METEVPFCSVRLSATEDGDAIRLEHSISSSSMSQFASVPSSVDDAPIQNLDGSSKGISAASEPKILEEGSAAGDAIAESNTPPRNSIADTAGGTCDALVDTHEINEMENLDIHPVSAHENPEHEELAPLDGWSAMPSCKKQTSSFDDAALPAEPLIQPTELFCGDQMGQTKIVRTEEGSRDNDSMDWTDADEPASMYVSQGRKEGIAKNADVMQTEEDEVADAIDSMQSDASKRVSTSDEHDGGLQDQAGEVRASPDLVAVVETLPVLREEVPPDTRVHASDLFESASIRELQNMLMDSSLRRPEIIPSSHKVGVDKVGSLSEIAVTLGPNGSELSDTRMSESAAVVEGQRKQKSQDSTLNDSSLNLLKSEAPDERELGAGVDDPQIEDIDMSQKAEEDRVMKTIEHSDPASFGDCGVFKAPQTDTESKPVMLAVTQEAEHKREIDGDEAPKNLSLVSVKAEEEMNQNMEIDKNVEAPEMLSEDVQNKDVQMDADAMHVDDILLEPQQSIKRGRKPGRKALKSVEKDAIIGLRPDSEPEKDTGDSPSKQPIEGEQKRELRKRGRKPAASKLVQKEEEDVCFVCFDGGKLILCDKRSCPKAYHVECTGRESEFFEKKGQWFCGWHVCSQCSKSANLNCYMCPSALCGTCIKGVNFLSIRKGHGLCEGCYPLVHMIEYNETVNGDPVQVDFNDKETYEGLFKEYWEELKLKLSLTSAEFKKAWKAREDGGTSGEYDLDNDDGVMNNDGEDNMEDENGGSTDSEDPPPTVRHARLMKRKRLTRHSVPEDISASEFEEDESDDEVKLESTPKKGRTRAPEFDGWASKELIDLIQSLKEDPKKPLPLFGVKKLLWRYIDENKLTNPRRRGQILCDERLRKIFGKKHVGRFEMMKLIGLHVASPNKSLVSKGREFQYSESDTVELDDAEEIRMGKKKARRKGDENKRFKPDPSEYAAINVKNINLIYLKRSVLDVLRNDPELESKAVGAFVRIRVPGSANKSDACYRLVQVVGVKQIYDALDAEKVTDVILEILNLHKREEITADLVSNQELVEEECQRLRQSVRCGFINAMSVGELEERARALREAKVKDWREFELLRLSHLRDRASEKGRKKELRECVEKLQLLSTPEEKERLLNAPFDIDADPFMDPDYVSEEEELPADDGLGETSAPQSAQERFFPARYPDKANSTVSGEKLYNHRDSGHTVESYKSLHDSQQKTHAWGQKDHGDNVNMRQTSDLQAQGLNSLYHSLSDKNAIPRQSKTNWGDNAKVRDQGTGWNQGSVGRKEVRWTGSSGGDVQSSSSGWRKNENVDIAPRFPVDQPEVSGPGLSPICTPALATSVTVVSVPSTGTMVIDSEKEKVWCYLDPTRTVQGPFTMEQLRKWEKTNLFPLDLRIWRVTESQDASILLSDALAGRFIGRGSFGITPKPNLPPSSVQGAHVNGIPVQGLNANFPIGQNGGNVTSGIAQGILSSPVPTPQRPILQGFPSSVQGLNAHSIPPGPIQGPSVKGFSSGPVHAPNVHGLSPVPTQGTNVHAFVSGSIQGPFVNNFPGASTQGTSISGPMQQGLNVTGYPPNLVQGVNVLPGQVQTPMILQGRPQGPNIVLGQMQGPNVLPGQTQAPSVMQGPHFNNAHTGHPPRGPPVNHFPMGTSQGAVHNSSVQVGQVVPNSTMEFRNANRHANEWQETSRRSGPDHHFSGPSSNMEGGNERSIPTRSPWRQGSSVSQQDNRDTHNRGPFGRAQSFRGSDHFQGSDGRFGPRKDLFCKYFSRGLCRKGPACDFRHV